MALTQQVLTSDQLVKQRKGYLGISITNWTTTTLPAIAAGSSIEIADSIYYSTAEEIIDSTGVWGTFGNSTFVYAYIDPASATSILTTTAPTWSTSKNGFYGTGELRLVGIIYKYGKMPLVVMDIKHY